MISSATSLSIGKTTKLLQSLVDLKAQNVELPDQISKNIDHAFKGGTEQQSYLWKTLVDFCTLTKFTLMKTKWNTWLQKQLLDYTLNSLLQLSSMRSTLPCHFATELSHNYLKLLIEIGMKHNIGGKDSRGCFPVPVGPGIVNFLQWNIDSKKIKWFWQMSLISKNIQKDKRINSLWSKWKACTECDMLSGICAFLIRKRPSSTDSAMKGGPHHLQKIQLFEGNSNRYLKFSLGRQLMYHIAEQQQVIETADRSITGKAAYDAITTTQLML